MKSSDHKLRLFGRILQAQFLSRPNRFLIRCRRKGRTVSAFLPNPGRLDELLIPGRLICLVRDDRSPTRKTHFTAVAVYRDRHPIMLHTHCTNEVVHYLLRKGKIPELEKSVVLKSEVRGGRSRFDFLLKEEDKDMLLEVKSCTLVGQRVAMFPDAVTERGSRHLRELAKFCEEGTSAAMLFVVHWPLAEVFMPDYHTDLTFAQTLLAAKDKVKVIAVSVKWNQDLSLSPETKLLRIPWQYIEQEATDRGSYLLILKLRKGEKIHIGKLGRVSFRKGFYVYVGSAMANLSKRMERHRHLRKRHHWHIDELRAMADFHSVLAIRSSMPLECEMAEALSGIAEWVIPGFGSTDCSCKTHLFAMSADPLQSPDFHRLLQYFRMDRTRDSLQSSNEKGTSL